MELQSLLGIGILLLNLAALRCFTALRSSRPRTEAEPHPLERQPAAVERQLAAEDPLERQPAAEDPLERQLAADIERWRLANATTSGTTRQRNRRGWIGQDLPAAAKSGRPGFRAVLQTAWTHSFLRMARLLLPLRTHRKEALR